VDGCVGSDNNESDSKKSEEGANIEKRERRKQ
jgi:hypothetical protein